MEITPKEFLDNYWRLYIFLEKELIKTFDYVSLSTENFLSYSNQFLKLILQIGSELDIVCKLYCNVINKPPKYEKFQAYKKIIVNKEKDFEKIIIDVINTKTSLNPWGEISTVYWKVYNKVKHERTNKGKIKDVEKQYYKFANLENCLNLLAALYQVEMFAFYEISNLNKKSVKVPLPPSNLFNISEGRWRDEQFVNSFYINCKDGILKIETV